MKVAVFVTSIVKHSSGRIVVEASNGSHEGPPFVRWETGVPESHGIHIGKRYSLTVEEYGT